jgi:hypothetical protein
MEDQKQKTVTENKILPIPFFKYQPRAVSRELLSKKSIIS